VDLSRRFAKQRRLVQGEHDNLGTIATNGELEMGARAAETVSPPKALFGQPRGGNAPATCPAFHDDVNCIDRSARFLSF
jgi:hypothetical protein